MKEFLECGKIANTHGVRGDVLIDSYCDTLADFCKLKTVYLCKGDDYLPLTIQSKPYRDRVLSHIEEIPDMDSAIAHKGLLIYAKREDFKLKKNSHFIADLIGLPVYDADRPDLCYGTVSDVINQGAQDIYVVKSKEAEYYLPAVSAFVVSIDIEKGIYYRPIEGMFS